MFLDEIASVIEAATASQPVGRRISRTALPRTLFYTSAAATGSQDGPIVVLVQTPGSPPLTVHNRPDGPAYLDSRCQVSVRARDPIVALQVAAVIWTACWRHNEAIAGTFYLKLRPLQEPFDLQTDESGRSRQVFNLEALRRPS